MTYTAELNDILQVIFEHVNISNDFKTPWIVRLCDGKFGVSTPGVQQ